MSVILNLLQYLFQPLPLGQFKFYYILVIIAVAALVASIALKLFLRKQKEDKIFKKLFRNLPGKLFTIAILEGLYVLVRFEEMPYVSIRFLNLVILIYAAYIVFHYGQIYYKIYPAEKKHHQEQIRLNRYLPRKNHKRR